MMKSKLFIITFAFCLDYHMSFRVEDWQKLREAALSTTQLKSKQRVPTLQNLP